MKIFFRILTTLLLINTINAFASPVLKIDADGYLYGAKGVVIKGKMYDVEFIDDPKCGNFFNTGCGVGFIPGYEASSKALLETVFVDSKMGLFDSKPWLTRGCKNKSSCKIASYTQPYYDINYYPGNPDFNYEAGIVFLENGVEYDYMGDGYAHAYPNGSWFYNDVVHAKWSISVPEPAPLLLFVAGFLGLAIVRKIDSDKRFFNTEKLALPVFLCLLNLSRLNFCLTAALAHKHCN